MAMPIVTPPVLAMAVDAEKDLSIEKMLLERDRALFEYFQHLVVRSPAPQVLAKAGGLVFLAFDLQFKKAQVPFPLAKPVLLQKVTSEMLANTEWEEDMATRMFETQRPLHAFCRNWCTKSPKPEAAKLGMTTIFRILDIHTEANRLT
jgi:hypothetical protein